MLHARAAGAADQPRFRRLTRQAPVAQRVTGIVSYGVMGYVLPVPDYGPRGVHAGQGDTGGDYQGPDRYAAVNGLFTGSA
jgi:hypothetical protein